MLQSPACDLFPLLIKGFELSSNRLRGPSPDAERRDSAAGRGGELGLGVRFGARAVRPSPYPG